MAADKSSPQFLRHVHGPLNWELVWETIQSYLPELKDKLEKIIDIIEKEEV